MSDLTRAMPFSDEAEKGILSCLLQRTELIDHAQAKLSPEAFYHPANRLVYETLLEFASRNRPIDSVTLTQHFLDNGTTDKIGGHAAILELYSFVPTSAHYPYYREIVEKKYLLRRIILLSTENIQRSYELQEEPLALLDEIETKTLALRPQDGAKTDSAGEYAMRAFESLEARLSGRATIGIRTGFSWLDRMTGGLKPELWYVAARPSVGKTSFLVQLWANCIALDIPCGGFSLEMSGEMLMNRLIACISSVSFSRLMGNAMSREEMRGVTRAVSTIQKSRFQIDDRTGLTHSEICAKARRWKRNHGVQMIGIDYLQRMAPTKTKGDRGRSEEHAENSTRLADASKELGIPFVVLAQFNRDPERLQRAPRLSDIEWCGRAEQDADVALLLSPVIEKKGEKVDQAAPIRKVLWHIAKQRNGPTDEAVHLFDRPSASFKAHPMSDA